jgi:hypothetical protein
MFGLASAVSALCMRQYRLRIPPGYLRSLSMTQLHYGDIDLAFARRISCFALAAESMSAHRLRLSVERSASSTRECSLPCWLRSDSPHLQTMIWKMSIGELLGARHAGPRWNDASETNYCVLIALALGPLIGCNGETAQVTGGDRMLVNEALTFHRMLVNGGGVGCMSGYVCGPDFLASPTSDRQPLSSRRPLISGFQVMRSYCL